MSTQSLITDEPATEPATATAGCDACRHPEAAHDPISRRYCAATTAASTAAASTRECICAGQ